MYIISWTNSWATSHRFHDDKLLPCLLGCRDCKDELKHYLQCPHLLALWTFLLGPTSADPLVRWGLIQPEKEQFKCISCIFSGYHAVRREFRNSKQFFRYNQNCISGQQLRCAWSLFADAVFVEASELAVNCRRFWLANFLSFLSDN